ncbi:MAG: response regulator [Alphaproteobacteria bacterium]|nr:response regulator [Alphaproteobacteria bacterium]
MAALEFSNLSILVFDQNFDRAKLVRELLDNLEVGETFATASPDAAIKTVIGNRLSMAVINLESTNHQASTKQFMDSIRNSQNAHAVGLPILGMMAEVTKQNLMSAVHLGADFVIQRPFSVNSLKDRISSMLQTPTRHFRSANYFGPDRRRMPDDLYGGDKRRADDDG